MTLEDYEVTEEEWRPYHHGKIVLSEAQGGLLSKLAELGGQAVRIRLVQSTFRASLATAAALHKLGLTIYSEDLRDNMQITPDGESVLTPAPGQRLDLGDMVWDAAHAEYEKRRRVAIPVEAGGQTLTVRRMFERIVVDHRNGVIVMTDAECANLINALDAALEDKS